MSIPLTTSVTDRATPVVLAISSAVKPAALRPIVGRSAMQTYRRHLFALNRSRPNALGGPRTNFYENAARGTQFQEVADGVIVSINQIGIRQRIVGGTIRPRTKKFLTIPVVPEAHGKRASEFPGLVLMFDRNGRPIGLGEKDITQAGAIGGGRRTSAASGIRMIFRLARSVTQQPDPTVVPPILEVAAGVFASVNSFVDRQVRRAQEGNQA